MTQPRHKYAESQLLPELPRDLRDLCFDYHNPWRIAFNYVMRVITRANPRKPDVMSWDEMRVWMYRTRRPNGPDEKKLTRALFDRVGHKDDFCYILDSAEECEADYGGAFPPSSYLSDSKLRAALYLL